MFQVTELFYALSIHFQNHAHTGFDCLFGKKFLLISAAQLEAATCLPSFLVLCTTVHDQAIGTLPQTPSNIYSLYCTMITFSQISYKNHMQLIPFLIFIILGQCKVGKKRIIFHPFSNHLDQSKILLLVGVKAKMIKCMLWHIKRPF